MLKTLRFKSSHFFGTHTLLNKLLRVLGLLHIYLILPQMDSSEIFDCIH